MKSVSLVVVIYITTIFAQNEPLIEISNGWLQGTFDKSYNGRIFSSFEGIPYAKPPVGDLRFEAPKEPYNWTGTWIADTKHQCLQSYSTPWIKPTVIGEEDCLYINVYVPREKPSSSDNMNVIVHFHGGGFMIGSGHLYAGPKYLMDEDAILVTMNYRLGPFGFLSTEDEIVPGNNGLKDQSLSLKWIKNNIKYFGGNPDSVTLTGMSAGGASVHLHYFSPLSKGLFHRGFSESGTALDPWVLQEEALKKAKRLAALVGCPSVSSREIVDCLKSRSSIKIYEKVSEFMPYMGLPLVPFAPVVEVENDGAFLTEHPYKMLVDNIVTDVAWVVSVSEQEGYLFALNLLNNFPDEFLEEYNKFAPYLLDYNYTLTETEKISASQKTREYYFAESVDFKSLGRLFGDRFFHAGADTSAKLQAIANEFPVYFFILGYKGKYGIGDMFGQKTDKDIGASHGDAVLYYLNAPISEPNLSENDEKIKNIFLTWLLSFANNGKPNIDGIEWKPVTGNKVLEYLSIKDPNDIRMEKIEDLGSNSFWKQFPFKENQNLLKEESISKDEL